MFSIIWIKKNFKKPNSKRLDKVINDLNKIINSKYCPNPTRHYKETKNHIPPWILFKNATFNTSIDYFVELEDSMRDSISKEIYTRGFNASSYSDFITSSLKIVKKFRNVIAHNLNFINTRTSDRLILKNVASEYFGTLTSRKDIRLNIGINDPYSMIISIITLLDEDFLIKEFVFDFVRSVMIIKNDRPKDLINKYFEFTNIPTDFENRFLNYLLKIDCKF